MGCVKQGIVQIMAECKTSINKLRKVSMRTYKVQSCVKYIGLENVKLTLNFGRAESLNNAESAKWPEFDHFRPCTTINACRKCDVIMSGVNGVFVS